MTDAAPSPEDLASGPPAVDAFRFGGRITQRAVRGGTVIEIFVPDDPER